MFTTGSKNKINLKINKMKTIFKIEELICPGCNSSGNIEYFGSLMYNKNEAIFLCKKCSEKREKIIDEINEKQKSR